ncbi:AAA family ATPase [Flavobacterium sp. ARAG 55.4]|uniref:AAA family ATPase n=1 Tax=Flavobacterium sp. ARAG 55.4 TaxID=3451357 RepID=UPI003F48E455
MTQQQKIKIVEDLEMLILQKGSQNKVAAEMKSVSAATLSQMRNHNWENIADEMWRKVASYLGTNDKEWVYCSETRNAAELRRIYDEAQRFREVYGIVGPSGHGKTASAKVYEENNRNVINIFCTNYMDERSFLSEVLAKMGKDSAGMTVTKLMGKIVLEVKSKENILFIFNEFDKLNDKVIYLFISLFNELEDDCGMVISATHFLERKIAKGVVLDKMGYREVLSRVGGKFFELEPNNYADTLKICSTNGVTNEEVIRTIYRDSKGDGRRIKRLVNSHKRANNERITV